MFKIFALFFLLTRGFGTDASTASAKPTLDSVVRAYIQAVGGQALLDTITAREVHAKQHHGPKLVYYWQKPDSILQIDGKKRTCWAGSSGWILSVKKRVTRLPKGSQRVLQDDADPLRYTRLQQLYPDAGMAADEQVDGEKMDVVQASNDRGVTKLYFDTGTHLLRRIEETGDTSAYFKHVTEFLDYKPVDGLLFPFKIVHSSNEPGAHSQELRISEVLQNMPLKPGLFVKPSSVAVTLGGKR